MLDNLNHEQKSIRYSRWTFALVASLALVALCQAAAKEQQQQQQPVAVAGQTQPASSFASRLLPKARSSRSLSDMFEKVKSRIFGSKKSSSSSASSSSSSSSAVQPASSSLVPAASTLSAAANGAAQRQPWDVSIMLTSLFSTRHQLDN